MNILISKRLAGLALGISLSVLLVGCQPPPSGDAAGMRYPMLYLKLQQQELMAPLPVPVEGVQARQISDTWGAARSEGRRHEGLIFLPNAARRYAQPRLELYRGWAPTTLGVKWSG